MREIKFRAWDTRTNKWCFVTTGEDMSKEEADKNPFPVSKACVFGGNNECIIMQYTGLKDKNGLQEVYEGDIIDEYGNIKGNIYEMDAGETDFIIQGFGDKNWGATYQNAVDRGCKDSE